MNDDLEKALGPRKGFEQRQKGAEENKHQHPELREGEVFLGNVRQAEPANFAYPSLRRGDVAYDSEGEPIEGMVPFFASKKEVEET